MTINKKQSSKRKLRFTFSLRILLIVFTIISVWFAWMVHRAKKQREAVSMAKEIGGLLFYDYQYDGSRNRLRIDSEPTAPDWLVNSLGIDFFSSAIYVHLDRQPNADFSKLRHLKNLRYLELSECELADLRFLSKMTSLEYLSLSHNPITNITPLKNLNRLKRLLVFDTKIDDISVLQNKTSLELLDLAHTQVSDLSPLENLQLASLDIQGTPVFELEPLSNIKTLTDLNVSHTNTRDFSPLHKLSALKTLQMRGQHTEQFDIDEVQSQLPNCKIR